MPVFGCKSFYSVRMTGIHNEDTVKCEIGLSREKLLGRQACVVLKSMSGKAEEESRISYESCTPG